MVQNHWFLISGVYRSSELNNLFRFSYSCLFFDKFFLNFLYVAKRFVVLSAIYLTLTAITRCEFFDIFAKTFFISIMSWWDSVAFRSMHAVSPTSAYAKSFSKPLLITKVFPLGNAKLFRKCYTRFRDEFKKRKSLTPVHLITYLYLVYLYLGFNNNYKLKIFLHLCEELERLF